MAKHAAPGSMPPMRSETTPSVQENRRGQTGQRGSTPYQNGSSPQGSTPYQRGSSSPGKGASSQRRKRKGGVARVIQWVATIVLVGCLVVLAAIGFQYLYQSSNYDKLQANVGISSQADAENLKLSDLTVDWDALKATNPDIVAWVYMPGTSINYPVVHTSDNETYLHTSFDRSSGFLSSKGCIFTDMNNQANMLDRNIVLYGHHMRDGSMFAFVNELRNQSTFDENRDLYVLTPSGNYLLRTFAEVITTGTDSIVVTSFGTNDSYRSYIQDKLNRSVVSQSDISANDVSQSFMLSTCEYTRNDGRAILYASVVATTVSNDPYVTATPEAHISLTKDQAESLGQL